MVDWDRVEQLRSKGWDWDRIAADPKVGFHADASVHDEGRALRGLYHRQKSRAGRAGTDSTSKRPSKTEEAATERKWNLPRLGYLLTPLFGLWFLLAYVAPSPVGILLPAFPWLGIALAVAAFILLFGLLRTREKRWSPALRTTLISGIVLGLVVSASAGIVGYVAFGCPYLPPASSLANTPGPGWAKASVSPWQDSGKPVLYFYGASWCPFCSAGSWAIYKALSEFGSVTGANAALGFSSLTDTDAGTPEIIIADLGYSSSSISLVVTEDTSGVDGNFPGTSDCFEQAYVSAYSGNSIPFVVINGQYIHGGTPIIQPPTLSAYTYAASQGNGAATVLGQVQTENGSGWSAVNQQAWWMMAFLVKGTGESVATLSHQYSWSSATTTAVNLDVDQLG
jgi:thiol-disulfide isomerase/thioredoxin